MQPVAKHHTVCYRGGAAGNGCTVGQAAIHDSQRHQRHGQEQQFYHEVDGNKPDTTCACQPVAIRQYIAVNAGHMHHSCGQTHLFPSRPSPRCHVHSVVQCTTAAPRARAVDGKASAVVCRAQSAVFAATDTRTAQPLQLQQQHVSCAKSITLASDQQSYPPTQMPATAKTPTIAITCNARCYGVLCTGERLAHNVRPQPTWNPLCTTSIQCAAVRRRIMASRWPNTGSYSATTIDASQHRTAAPAADTKSGDGNGTLGSGSCASQLRAIHQYVDACSTHKHRRYTPHV